MFFSMVLLFFIYRLLFTPVLPFFFTFTVCGLDPVGLPARKKAVTGPGKTVHMRPT